MAIFVALMAGAARDARAQHVTADMARTTTAGMQTEGCEARAGQAATILDGLRASLERARQSGDEAEMRAAATAAQAGFADVRSRLEACRARAVGRNVTPAAVPAAPTPVREANGAAEAALQSFRDALQVGNRDVALHWLAPDVRITESGMTDASRDAYASRHMALDMTFLKTAKVVLLDRQVHPGRESTHIVTTSRITGRAGETAVDVTIKEGALLKKTPQGWRIASIEWSAVPVR